MSTFSLFQTLPVLLVEVIIFMLIILFYLLGYRVRTRITGKDPGISNKELGAINGTLLGLLGLLLAFTFGMASARYDARRKLIVEEANNISTVILRTEILPDSLTHTLKEKLKTYVETRIGFYTAGMDKAKMKEYTLQGDNTSKEIWNMVAAYAKKENALVKTSELVPALNAMIDITTTRREAGEANIPDSIMYFLLLLCCCSSFLLGYDNRHTIDWILLIGFAIVLSITVITIIDLDRPRSGLINMDSTNQLIVELRGMFK